MTDIVVESITNRYIELYEHVTGEKFMRHLDEDPLVRIERNIMKYLEDQ